MILELHRLFDILDWDTRIALARQTEQASVSAALDTVAPLVEPWLAGQLGDIVGSDGAGLVAYALWRLFNGRSELSAEQLRSRYKALGLAPGPRGTT